MVARAVLLLYVVVLGIGLLVETPIPTAIAP